MSDSTFSRPSMASHQPLPPPDLPPNPLCTPIKLLSQSVATMKALAGELEKDEHGAQYKYVTNGVMKVAARFSQLEAQYEAARKRRHEDAYSELREHLIHKRINKMEADCKVMWAILNDPARAKELFRARASYWPMRAKELGKENEHMQARFMKYQEDISKLRRQSADWNMWCL